MDAREAGGGKRPYNWTNARPAGIESLPFIYHVETQVCSAGIVYQPMSETKLIENGIIHSFSGSDKPFDPREPDSLLLTFELQTSTEPSPFSCETKLKPLGYLC